MLLKTRPVSKLMEVDLGCSVKMDSTGKLAG
jgi:hypothetical protein